MKRSSNREQFKTTISVRGEIEFTRGGFGGRRGCRRGRGIWSPWGGARRRGGGCGRARNTPPRSRHRARALPWALIARTSPPPNSPPPSTPTPSAADSSSFLPSGDLWLDAFPVVRFRGATMMQLRVKMYGRSLYCSLVAKRGLVASELFWDFVWFTNFTFWNQIRVCWFWLLLFVSRESNFDTYFPFRTKMIQWIYDSIGTSKFWISSL